MTKKEICNAKGTITVGYYGISNNIGVEIKYIDWNDDKNTVYFIYSSGDKIEYHKSRIYENKKGLYFNLGKMRIYLMDCFK